MSQNDKFQQVCKMWVQKTQNMLSSSSTEENEGIPFKEDIEVTFHAHGYDARKVRKIDLARLYTLLRDRLVSLPEYHQVIKLVTKTPDLSSILYTDIAGKVLSDTEQQKVMLEMYFSTLLIEYLKISRFQIPLDTFDQDAFSHTYEKLEQFIFSTQPFDGIWSVHLRNVTSEIDTLRIDYNIFLRRATHEEKVDALRKDRNLFFDSPELQIAPGLQIAPDIPNVFLDIHQPIHRASDRTFPPDMQDAKSIAQRVVLALRLLKANPVGIASYHWDTPEQPFLPYKGIKYEMILHPFAYQGASYILTQEDADVLPTLWRQTKKAYTDPEFSVPITRFEDSYLRTKLEDQLIDYWIALEALFFSLIEKEFIGSMGETVASTISYYLGKTQDERRSIHDFIISSHVARGRIVHGRGSQVNNLDLVVRKTKKYLSMALRTRLEESVVH